MKKTDSWYWIGYFMAEHGFMTPEDWANMGLKTTK